MSDELKYYREECDRLEGRLQDAVQRAEKAEAELDAMTVSHASLCDRLATAEAAVKELVEALRFFVENDTTPPKNCRCHISPPCNDCVDNQGTREAVSLASQLIAKHGR